MRHLKPGSPLEQQLAALEVAMAEQKIKIYLSADRTKLLIDANFNGETVTHAIMDRVMQRPATEFPRFSDDEVFIPYEE